MLPIAQFTAEPGFDLGCLWTLDLRFEDCEGGYCPGTVPARHFRIGAPRFEIGAATPALRRSWGRLKAAYRWPGVFVSLQPASAVHEYPGLEAPSGYLDRV